MAVYEQIFIKREYDFETEKPLETIIDAGANIGLASIYFSKKYSNAKIIVIEPERNNFELLKENVKQYINIIPINAALWNKNEEIDIIDIGLGESGFITEKKKIFGGCFWSVLPFSESCHS